jgi:hypothetical protein
VADRRAVGLVRKEADTGWRAGEKIPSASLLPPE